tara:strand:+ start:5038 stop:5430 length:393 start_codon:yes stop_codon:yes gene_type:complete
MKASHKKHRDNPEYKEYNREYQKNRREVDSTFKVKDNLRSRIYNAIQDGFKLNKNKFIDEIGCDIEEYFVYLEQRWDNNMSWDNYGKYWEIDHIIPISKGGSFHYKNTQPLTVTENRHKSDKIPHTYNRI